MPALSASARARNVRTSSKYWGVPNCSALASAAARKGAKRSTSGASESAMGGVAAPGRELAIGLHLLGHDLQVLPALAIGGLAGEAELERERAGEVLRIGESPLGLVTREVVVEDRLSEEIAAREPGRAQYLVQLGELEPVGAVLVEHVLETGGEKLLGSVQAARERMRQQPRPRVEPEDELPARLQDPHELRQALLAKAEHGTDRERIPLAEDEIEGAVREPAQVPQIRRPRRHPAVEPFGRDLLARDREHRFREIDEIHAG